MFSCKLKSVYLLITVFVNIYVHLLDQPRVTNSNRSHLPTAADLVLANATDYNFFYKQINIS